MESQLERIKNYIKSKKFKEKTFKFFTIIKENKLIKWLFIHKKVVLCYFVTFSMFSVICLGIVDYNIHLGILFKKESTIIEESRRKYEEYRKIQSDDLHCYWVRSLKNFNSQKAKMGAIQKVVSEFGGNLEAENTNILAKKLNAYLEVQLTYRLDVSQLKTGDFIMFKPKWVGSKQVYDRVGIVEQVLPNGVIKYIDWNGDVGTIFQNVKSYDSSIEKFVEFSWPIWTGTNLRDGIRITRGFSLLNHYGVDFRMANPDRQVLSFTDGVVVKAFNDYNPFDRWAKRNSGGNYCIVRTNYHGKTVYVQYFHLEKLKVRLNQKIKKGTMLGIYADVGYSFGRHCHLSLFNKYNYKYETPEEAVDPMPILAENCSFILFNQYTNFDDSQFIASNQFLDRRTQELAIF